MKPDWKDAPEWAQYLAQDADGGWFWYEVKPRPEIEFWCQPRGLSRVQNAMQPSPDWTETLEERPQ